MAMVSERGHGHLDTAQGICIALLGIVHRIGGAHMEVEVMERHLKCRSRQRRSLRPNFCTRPQFSSDMLVCFYPG